MILVSFILGIMTLMSTGLILLKVMRQTSNATLSIKWVLALSLTFLLLMNIMTLGWMHVLLLL